MAVLQQPRALLKYGICRLSEKTPVDQGVRIFVIYLPCKCIHLSNLQLITIGFSIHSSDLTSAGVHYSSVCENVNTGKIFKISTFFFFSTKQIYQFKRKYSHISLPEVLCSSSFRRMDTPAKFSPNSSKESYKN